MENHGITKEYLEEVNKATKELREELDKRSADAAKIENIEKFLAEYDEKNTKLANDLAAEQKKAQQLEEQVKSITEQLGNARARGHADYREGAEYKSFMTFLTDFHNISVEQKQLLRTDNQISGGYLVPTMVEQEIIKNITETSPIRQFARVQNVQSKTTEIVRRIKPVIAQYEGEAATGGEGTQEYASESLTVHRLHHTVAATQEMLLGSMADIQREFSAEIVEAFQKAEGLNGTRGDGFKKPQGFTTDARVEKIDTLASGTLDLDDLIIASGELKTGYNPWYYMNRRTLAYLRRQKAATTGEYLWSPAVAEGAPAMFNGYPYSAAFIDMDSYDDGTGAIPVAFGDLREAYRLYDRTGLVVIRDEATRKKDAVVEWTFYRFNDGRVVKPEALKLIRIAA